MADLYHLNEWFFALPWLYSMGCDVAVVTLPFHGRRQTAFSPFSGHGFFAGGLSRMNEAFAQAVLDVRHLVDWFERQGATSTGVNISTSCAAGGRCCSGTVIPTWKRRRGRRPTSATA